MNKIITYSLSLLPFLYIFYQSIFNQDIINPYSYLIISSGYIAISMIIVVLSVPIMFSIKSYIERRVLGIMTFFASLFHLLLYLIDNNLSLEFILEDLISLRFIQVGYLALILFIPLFVTSSDTLQKKLGSKWLSIHRLIYLILVLSLIHYYLIIKADYLIFNIYLFIILSVLLIKKRIYKT